MIAVLAVELRIPPAEVWAMEPRDMATVVAVLEQRAKMMKG